MYYSIELILVRTESKCKKVGRAQHENSVSSNTNSTDYISLAMSFKTHHIPINLSEIVRTNINEKVV